MNKLKKDSVPFNRLGKLSGMKSKIKNKLVGFDVSIVVKFKTLLRFI